MNKHTPTPWTMRKALHPSDGAYDWAIGADIDDHEECIAEVFGRSGDNSYPPAEANAAFIVRACNSHYELLEALERLLKDYDPEARAIDVIPDGGCIECTHGVTPNDKNTGLCAYHSARAAIDKATKAKGE